MSTDEHLRTAPVDTPSVGARPRPPDGAADRDGDGDAIAGQPDAGRPADGRPDAPVRGSGSPSGDRGAGDAHDRGSGGDHDAASIARQYGLLIRHSAVTAVAVVGTAIMSFFRDTRAWTRSLRPPQTGAIGSSAPGTQEARPDDGPAGRDGSGPAGSGGWGPRAAARAAAATASLRGGATRLTDRARARTTHGTGTPGIPAPPAAVPGGVGAASATATLAPPRPADVPAGYDTATLPTVGRDGRPVRRGRTVHRGLPALPLPDNPAAPRPKLAPEDPRPLAVKLGMLLIGAVAGVAATVMAVGALVPRAVADVRDSVDVEVILPQSATFTGLEQPSRVYAADGTQLAELRAEVNRQVVPLDQIPLHMREAVIAAEDRAFYEHPGYSIEGIGRALFTNLRTEGVSEGGSTLTQQLAKMNFVGDEVTLERKISELFYAMKLEEEFTKDELLERYLNEIYFGASAYGVQAAAQEYFGVDAEDLTVDQSALLAGVLPAPSAYNPRTNPDVARDRRNDVLDDMVDIGALTPTERNTAAARPIEVIDPIEVEVREPYVVAAVKRLFLDDPAFGATRQEREDKLFRGDLDIFTTLDPELQEMAEETIDARYGNSEGPTASIATVEPETGAIVAFASGQEFDAEQFDYALQGRQQPGSAFKTFVLAKALQEGFSPNITLAADSPLEVTYDGGRSYEPSNYGGADYGVVDMATALRRSINTYFVQLFEIVGREKAVELAGQMGIDVPAAIGTGADYGPSLVLGGLKSGVTPVEMAGAYATFANGGVFHRPYLIERVVDGSGNELLTRGADEGEQLFSEEINAVIVDIMRDVPAPGGTAPAANIAGWPEAGKTGTTNDNTDAWFAGYTPVLSTAVWVGYPDEDVSMPGATGGSTAAPVWADFMRRAHEGRDVVNFPSVQVNYGALFRQGGQVPNVAGDSEVEALRALAENRIIGSVVEVASAAPQGRVLGVSPGPGVTTSRATLTVSTGVPPPPPPPPEPEPAPEPEASEDTDEAPAPESEPAPEEPAAGGGGGGGGDGAGGGGGGGGSQGEDRPVKPDDSGG